MKLLKFTFILMVVSLAPITQILAQDVEDSQLKGKWILKSINNRDSHELFTNKTPHLIFNFDIEQISGNTGCYTYSGKFNYSGGKFEAPNIASVDTICSGSNDEATFVGLLNKSSKLSILNGELIFSQDDKPVLVFYRAKPLTSEDLVGVWKLQSINGKTVDADFAEKTPTLEFNFIENSLSGSAGCNNYNTSFTLSENVLDLQPLITTRMACENLKGEAKFVETFSGRVDIDIENDVLVLRKENQPILTFTK